MSKILSSNRRNIPHPDPMRLMETLLTVLVAGGVGDYAAYYSGYDDEEWTARHGNKLSFEEASIHFPGIKRENYRD